MRNLMILAALLVLLLITAKNIAVAPPRICGAVGVFADGASNTKIFPCSERDAAMQEVADATHTKMVFGFSSAFASRGQWLVGLRCEQGYEDLGAKHAAFAVAAWGYDEAIAYVYKMARSGEPSFRESECKIVVDPFEVR